MTIPDPASLAPVPLFAGASTADLEKLSHWFEVETFHAGHIVTREHQSGYAFYVLSDGRAHAEHQGTTINTLEPGSVFGEMAFFDPHGRRQADVVMDTDATVFCMFGTHFREMQMGMPEVAARIEALVKEHSTRDVEAAGQDAGS